MVHCDFNCAGIVSDRVLRSVGGPNGGAGSWVPKKTCTPRNPNGQLVIKIETHSDWVFLWFQYFLYTRDRYVAKCLLCQNPRS